MAFTSEIYNHNTLFAEVNHTELLKGPGSSTVHRLPSRLFNKCLVNTTLCQFWPTTVGPTVLRSYLMSILTTFISPLYIVSKLAIGSFSQSVNFLQICPQTFVNHAVSPSMLWNKCLNGTSFKCNKQIKYSKGRKNLSS